RPGCAGPSGYPPGAAPPVPDGGQDGAFQVGDRGQPPQQLEEMDLDWDLPPYPPASEQATRLRVQVLPPEALPPSKELDAEAYFERGLLLVQLGHLPWSDIDRVRALNPKVLRWDEVLHACEQVIERNPEDAGTYHLRAHTHEWLGQWAQAVADHSRAIKLAPQRLDYHVCRGRAYLRTGQMD